MSYKKKTLLLLFINSLILIPLYFIIPLFGFSYIHYVYLAVGAGLVLWFVIYNKGFVYKNLTVQDLSPNLSLEERTALIEQMKTRFHNSRIVLTVVLPILITFILDAVYLFILPMLGEWFSC